MRRLAYQTRYGYQFFWAALAEIAWRFEHWFPRVTTFYRWRKRLERRGAAQ